MARDEAIALLIEYTKSESLRKHALAVEAAMRRYAERFGENVETWWITGLFHDFDYECWPKPPDHTQQGARILREHMGRRRNCGGDALPRGMELRPVPAESSVAQDPVRGG